MSPLKPVFDYSWDLDGDSVFETVDRPRRHDEAVAPAAPGSYPVSLRVTDGLGNTSTVKRSIEVLPRHPSRDRSRGRRRRTS